MPNRPWPGLFSLLLEVFSFSLHYAAVQSLPFKKQTNKQIKDDNTKIMALDISKFTKLSITRSKLCYLKHKSIVLMTNLSLRDSCTVLLSSFVKSEAFFVFEVTLLGFSISMRPLTPFGLTCHKNERKKPFQCFWEENLGDAKSKHTTLNTFVIPLPQHFTIIRNENIQKVSWYYKKLDYKNVWIKSRDHSGKRKSYWKVTLLSDGLTYNTHFTHCLCFSLPLWGSEKYCSTCKISVRTTR